MMVSELKTKLADVKKSSSKDVAALQSKLAKVPSTVHLEQKKFCDSTHRKTVAKILRG